MTKKIKITGILVTGWLATAVLASAAPAWMNQLSDAGLEFNGFAEYSYGLRTQSDPYENKLTLNEARLQLDALWYRDLATLHLKTDLVYNDLEQDREKVNLDTGEGFLDLRLANVQFSPLSFMDVTVGRQIITWGTGDLIFINDLFPKDWQSFFLGRNIEYLKAPSDAVFLSGFSSFANVDLAYTPCFDSDRYITGEYLSYWNGQQIVGQNSILQVDRPNQWFTDDEWAMRVYKNISGYEAALYGYNGYWKVPGGMDPNTGRWIFPPLSVYGSSIRGAMAGGIANIEAGYYDSRDNRDGDDPFINNSEMRLLLGYEREIIADTTAGVQYYVEHMMHHDNYLTALDENGMGTDTAREEDRHTVTLRITQFLMRQKIVISFFARYSPSDHDAYIKPIITYKVNDNWETSLGGNFFIGEDKYTFLRQFEKNNNAYVSLRYSF